MVVNTCTITDHVVVVERKLEGKFGKRREEKSFPKEKWEINPIEGMNIISTTCSSSSFRFHFSSGKWLNYQDYPTIRRH